MNRKYLAALAAAAWIGSVGLGPVSAQPGPGMGPGMGPGGMGGGFMGPGMMGRGMGAMCNPSSAGFTQWRADRIERAVQPNESQKAALNELRNASTKAAEALSASCPKDFPKTSSERFAFMEKRMEAMLQAIRTVRPAFDAFYATLNVEQKERLDSAGPRRWGGWGQRWREW